MFCLPFKNQLAKVKNDPVMRVCTVNQSVMWFICSSVSVCFLFVSL